MNHVFVIGVGKVGTATLEQLEFLSSSFTIIGSCSSSKVSKNWLHQTISFNGDVTAVIEEYLSTHKDVITPCLIDCTSSQEITSKYQPWLQNNWVIVVANKKGLSSSTELFNTLRPFLSRRLGIESTVGAGLPIIYTIRNMVETGDQIYSIQGVMSGTLSFIFNQFCSCEKSYSSIVLSAREKGFTEPDPRDDLNGMDAARKCLILARIAGLDLELADITVENLVPTLLAKVTLEEFIGKLSTVDEGFEKKRANARSNNKVLRYIATVDVINKKCSAALEEIDSSHPFFNLHGTDNIFAINSKRFPLPLVIRGAGAGAQVTAFGILSDLIRLTFSQ